MEFRDLHKANEYPVMKDYLIPVSNVKRDVFKQQGTLSFSI